MGILRELRQNMLLTQRELARLADVDRRTIINLERDPPTVRPHPQTLRSLAKALGCPPSDLAPLLEAKEGAAA